MTSSRHEPPRGYDGLPLAVFDAGCRCGEVNMGLTPCPRAWECMGMGQSLGPHL